MLLELIILCLFVSCSGRMLRCTQIYKPLKFEFYAMQTCTHSTQKVFDQIYANDLEYCKEFALQRKGMGFNYVPPENLENGKANCIIYECPELNVTSLKQFNSPYHYYSAYARILPAENTTCVPREGVYLFGEEKLNYTEAITRCEEYGGRLADVITEEATNRVANLIAKSKNGRSKLQAYVGLHDMNQEGKFLSINDEPLNCVPFRSWAPGEPRSRYEDEDCVTVDGTRYWRVHRCQKSMPFICEITPAGPLDLAQAYCTNVDDAGVKRECEDYFTSAEIETENETCNRTYEELNTIRERDD